MIIGCVNCNKKFDVKSNLIPKEGRLVQCNSCSHKWFFKNEIKPNLIEPTENKNLEIFDIDINKSQHTNNKNDLLLAVKKTEKPKILKAKNINKSSIPNLFIVFTISVVALIIFVDTFKNPISKIFPNIEFLLYNLYESFKDAVLFFKDLI